MLAKVMCWNLSPRKIILLVLWLNLVWSIFVVGFHVFDKANLQYNVQNKFGYYYNFETNILITWIELLVLIVSIARINKEKLSTLTYTIVIFFIDAIFSIFLVAHCTFSKPEKSHSNMAIKNIIRVYYVLLLSNCVIRIFSAFIIHLNKIEEKENAKDWENRISFEETVSFSREATRALNIYVHSPHSPVSI